MDDFTWIFLKAYGGNLKVLKINSKCVKYLSFFSSVPSFYQAVVKYCFFIGGGNTKTPLKFRNARKHLIWGNQFNTINNTPIFNNNLSNAGVRYVNDLLDHQNNL